MSRNDNLVTRIENLAKRGLLDDAIGKASGVVPSTGGVFTGVIYVNEGAGTQSKLNDLGFGVETPDHTARFEARFDKDNLAMDYRFNADTSFTINNQAAPSTKYAPTSEYHLTRKDYVDSLVAPLIKRIEALEKENGKKK
jgi:hypothetical protein